LNATFAVARREIGEKAFVLIAACVLVLVPFLATLIPGVRQFDAHQVIITTAAFLSVGFAWGLAVILGATVVGRDLSERRLSFYFARPISPAAIWFGKMAASLVMVVVSFAILFVPAIAFAMTAWRRSWNVDLRLFIGGVIVVSIALLFLMHALSTMIRSRSAFVIADFAILIITALIATAIVVPLVFAFAMDLAWFVGSVLAAAFVAALIGAGWYQLAEGRVERRQSHRALSLALWSSFGCVLLIAAIYVAWVVSAKPKDLASIRDLTEPANGPWIGLSGRARHRFDFHPGFVLNTEDGSSHRIGGAFRLGLGASFSRDGRTVAWAEKASLTGGRYELVFLRLNDNTRVETGIPVTTFSDFALSDDANRVAVFSDVISIWDVRQRKLIGSIRPPDGVGRWMSFFTNSDHLRLIAVLAQEQKRITDGPRDHTIRIFEYDLAKRMLATLGETHILTRNVGVNANADGSLLLLRRFGGDSATQLIDGRTAATIATIPSGGDADAWRPGMFRILSNGMLAISQHSDTDSIVRFYSLDGTLRHELRLNGVTHLPVIGEVAPGKLAVAAYRGPVNTSNVKNWSALVIDSATGTIVTKGDGLWPASLDYFGGFGRDPRRAVRASPPVFVDANHALITWNPLTGARKTILPAGTAKIE
jgi:ABC-type transport system involved in multi-copper enzyme maturation permease subunit